MDLRIRKVTVFPLRIPLKNPIYISARAINFTDTLIVKIETEDGYIGWGESAASHRMTGEVLPGMSYVVNEILAPLLIEKSAVDYVSLCDQIQRSAYKNTGAKCAVEMALLDLVAKFQKIPLHQLLGEKIRSVFSPIFILGNKNFSEDLEQALKLKKQGIKFFKVKIGLDSIDREIDNACMLLEMLGPDVKLCADANMGLSFSSAYKYLIGAGPLMEFIEEPLQNTGPEELEKLKQISNTKICGDEQIHDFDDIDKFKSSIDGINFKTIKFSGLLNTVKACVYSQQLGLDINISQKIAETSIASKAVLHLASVIPSLNWGVSLTNEYLKNDIVKNSIQLDDKGQYIVDESIGIGVDVDESKIANFLYY